METATTNCSVSISENGRLLALQEHNAENYTHSEQLHVFLEEALAQASLQFSELDAVAVSKGPGSYTGLRIGVSAAKGLCFALDIPLISIATLESLSHQVQAAEGELIIPLLDARRMEVYSAVFDHNHEQLRETKAEIIDEGSFQEYGSAQKRYLIGNGAEKCKGIIKGDTIEFFPKLVPSAKEMAQLSYKKYVSKDFEDVAYFEPYYLKDFILGGTKG